MTHAFWNFITQLGNSLWLLPTAGLVAAWLWWGGERRLAMAWACCFGTAVACVLASKIAFLGWGVGIPALDFTGISGHGTVATAVFTMLAYLCIRTGSPGARRWVLAGGLLVGLAVSVSRVVLDAHSVSEVVAGFALGATAVLGALALDHRSAPVRLPYRWAAACVVGAMLLGTQAPQQPVQAHGFVVRLALMASGRAEVYDRSLLHRSTDVAP